MNVTIITPPLVQLNSPYPSGAYLTDFFKKMDCTAKWFDLSIELYYSIFSREGLTKLFELTSDAALKMAAKAEKSGDDSTAFNLRRYVSSAPNWISWIDTINAILCGKAREKEHQFLFSPDAPRGNRMDNFLANLPHDATVDDVRFLCSYALADLSDYIAAVLDPNFSLIRYAEAVTADSRTFHQVEQELNSPILEHFYEPVLEQKLGTLPVTPEPQLFCISIPFAGTYIPALYTACYIKNHFGNNALISIGGGYVNTELRQFADVAASKYIDFISYDRGYGSYRALLKGLAGGGVKAESLYKLAQFKSPSTFIPPLWESSEDEKYETETTCKIIPDYTDIDFSRYLRVCDDTNPMHRLWTDGAWIKAYLAHGCYWHKCAFCDTKLDYVCGYKITDVEMLYEGLLKTAREKGVYGIHFVDEALPPVALKRFALCNARNGNPLYFWGNVRFEKAFTKDLAAFLSHCGFGGVSAGIEVATGEGLKNINKGTDLQSITGACAAFKEAGILVHAYMIFGFWYDTPQTIIDSMETLRQFYAAGLLDSSFWHQFMLTKYSPRYDELKNLYAKDKNMTAKFTKYANPLESALTAWMHGQKLEAKVQKWFDFPVPAPTVPKNLIENCIDKYVTQSEKIPEKPELYWLGTKPVVSGNLISWFYLQEENSIETRQVEPLSPETFAAHLWNLRPEAAQNQRELALSNLHKTKKMQSLIQKLHNNGLCLL